MNGWLEGRILLTRVDLGGFLAGVEGIRGLKSGIVRVARFRNPNSDLSRFLATTSGFGFGSSGISFAVFGGASKGVCRHRTGFAMMVSGSPPKAMNNNGQQLHSFGPFSGGGMSGDCRLSFGYASFQGKRATMEDFFDAKISKIDDQDVGLFGVFDGHGGSRAAEYLKKHLFENLINHPQFTTDTRLALCACRSLSSD
eukprot:TRINITY_DN8486_c0_g1_i3.p1 TRINITY_DN8486_c0_g1~~TRINITY_DN8486_c0_g1_i3.p1  ORF type:complete len:198 (-),score=35.73 TRINITY_DN8486_c0_g1_i3:1010-1603(-)